MLISYTLSSQIIYVDQNATGSNNGTDWANAYTNLQTAITNIGANTTINVAQGIYYPTVSTDRTINFSIPRDKTIFGRFPTGGGTRDSELNPTILSGDIGAVDDNTDNSYHVVLFNGTSYSTEIDGFIIEKGYANGSGTNESNGGGILILTADVGDSNAYIRNCIVRNNFAVGDGGGIFVSKRAEIYNCKIYSNQVNNSGGGISISTNGRIYNSYIVNNKSVNFGGGIKITGINTAPKAINCVIANNECEYYGAGAYLAEGYLNNCTIVNNGGNGVHFGSYGSTFNGIIWGNSTYQSTHVASSVSHKVENNLIQDISTTGTNIGISSVNNGVTVGENYPNFTNPTTFTGNATTPAQLDEILNANWSINPQSAAIDFGDNDSYPTTTDTPIVDIIGNNRTINTTMDSGAYEALTNIITKQASNQSPTSATLNGEILFAETLSTINRGFVYATTSNFDVTTAISVTNSGTGIGVFSEDIIGLTEDQIYYFKTWIQFDGIKYYGNQIQFKASNLVAYYPFNGNVNDESGNENHGTVIGATLTTDKSENTDSAYSFDGISNYISISDNPTINVQTGKSFTISYWAKHNNTNAGVYMISKYMGAIGVEPSYGLGTGSHGNSYSWFEFTAGDGMENRGTINLTDMNWHNITTVFKSGESVAIFVDGVLDIVNPTSYVGSIINTNDLTIGCNANLSRFYNGSIDEIKIYNRALTDSEILNETLAVATEKLNENLNFYTNNNILHFKNTQNLIDIKNIEIYNLLGQKVYNSSKIEEEISLEQLKQGVYILKVINNSNYIQTLRFLIY